MDSFTNAESPDGRFNTAADVAYDIVKAKILSGEFQPGEKLSRRKMAKLTGVSVIPVIEALKPGDEHAAVR